MGQKIAMAFVHGMGKTPADLPKGKMEDLRGRFSSEGADPNNLVMKPVYWSLVLQGLEDELSRRTKEGGPQGYGALQNSMISFAGDDIAYQPAPQERDIYEKIHRLVA
jgi:hypothetical protein